ncbi:MAG: GH92 family glycosyl hydrolase [Flavobacteriales bacterium]|nr:GH92 family glycosyl hydrolase [Flavobacteriales bacterium]
MKRIGHIVLLIAGSVGLFSCESKPAEPEYVTAYDYVNPFIGTGGHGHTYPGATLPFGMVQLSPDTRLEGWDGCSGYHYTDSIIYGFSHTHLSGTGVGDYGDVLLMPTQGEVQFDNGYKSGAENGYASWFDKATEKASPGYYEVKLAEHDIDVRLTTTERVGIHEYTFNKADTCNIVLDLMHRDKIMKHDINVVNEIEIEGFRVSEAWAQEQHIYFVIQLSKAFEAEAIFTDMDEDERGDINNVYEQKIALRIPTKAGEKIMLKVGISAVSIEGARKNLEAEAPHWDFEQYKADAKTKWEQALNKIQVAGTDKTKLTNFYTALYHTMIVPNVFSDVDGKYRGMDRQIHESKDPVYTVFSLWDTFRATHPLYTIIEQKRTNAFIRTFLKQYQDGGIIPIWELAANYTGCMIGYHAIPVMADAYLKGIRDYDADLALQAMVHSARQDHLGLEAYKSKGYIAAGDESESVSKTLEYAYDDWCIAQMAKTAGKDSLYKEFIGRAQYYKNIFNPETGFMQAKMNSGWSAGFNPAEVNFNFTEANSWQYSMFVPQDIQGLIALHGGSSQLEQKLDELFTTEMELAGREQADITGLIGQYAHGNEPSHHMAYLYNYVGAPYKTQERVHQILTEQYHDQPDGLSGNEDCGQMSAWYVLSAMGFYSVTPGTDYYAVGTPLFEAVTINLENGKQFKIFANGVSDQNKYIQSATLNGEVLNTAVLYHDQIMAGGELVFDMGPNPNPDWGTENMPVPSIAEADQIVPVPVVKSPSMTFEQELKVELQAVAKGSDLYFRLDSGDFIPYKDPLSLTETSALEAYAERGGKRSKTVKASFKKIDAGRSIEILTPYDNQYNAGGDQALIDQLKGTPNFRTGFWQGYYGKDVEVIIDLGKLTRFQKIRVGALQDIKSWIWFPKEVEVWVAETRNGHFKESGRVLNDFPDNKEGAFTTEFVRDFNYPIQSRFIKIKVKNYGKCPEWHLGNGNDSWLFLDEITVE